MKHLKKGRKFGRPRSQRKALFKIMAHNLIRDGKIATTEAKAKELRLIVEPLITRGKKQDLASLRILLQKLPKESAYKVFYELSPRYKGRKGGYTRVIKHSEFRTDGARRATIEFV